MAEKRPKRLEDTIGTVEWGDSYLWELDYLLDSHGHGIQCRVGNEDEGILWAEGNHLLIGADDSLGKTFLLLQLIKSLLTGEKYLGRFTVQKLTERERILLIMMDRGRPTIDRMSQMFMMDPELEALVREKVRLVDGFTAELDGSIDEDVTALENAVWGLERAWRQREKEDAEREGKVVANPYGDPLVIIDGVDALTKNINEADSGTAIRKAISHLTSAGKDVVATTHTKKAQRDWAPKGVKSDIYGSRQITAAFGSIVVLTPAKASIPSGVRFNQDKAPSGSTPKAEGLLLHINDEHRSIFFDGSTGDAVKALGRATVPELEVICGLKESTVRDHLRKLMKDELVTKTPGYSDGSQRYPDTYEWNEPSVGHPQPENLSQPRNEPEPSTTGGDGLTQ